MIVERGSRINFTCAAVGNGTLTVAWKLPSGAIVSANQTSDYEWRVNSMLTIDNIATNNGGKYTCVAENEVGVSRATAMLSIRLYISGEQTGLSTSNGTVASMTCMIEGFLIRRYVWKKFIASSGSGSVSGSGSGSDNGDYEYEVFSGDYLTDCENDILLDCDPDADGESGSGSDPIIPDDTLSTGQVLIFNPVTFGNEGMYHLFAAGCERTHYVSNITKL